MSQIQSSTAKEVNDALTGDEAMQSEHERVLAGRILIVLALVVVLVAVIVMLFGLPALNIIALIATVVVFVLLIAYATGF